MWIVLERSMMASLKLMAADVKTGEMQQLTTISCESIYQKIHHVC